MKQKIDPKDIRKGDLIRFESEDTRRRTQALEYKAICDGDLQSDEWGAHYLLERPELPFEPYWGMVIGEPHEHHNNGGVKAVYVPTGDGQNWFSHPEPEGKKGIYYFDDTWAKKKLAEGWVIIEKQGGAK